MSSSTKDHFDFLLSFISSFDEWDSFSSFYSDAASFFTEKLQASECSILSLPAHVEKARESTFRILHTSREMENFQLLEELEKKKDLYIEIGEGRWQNFEENNSWVIKLGGYDQQFIYLSCTGANIQMGDELQEFLGNFLVKGFSHVKKWTILQHTKNLIHIDDVTGLFNQRRLMQDLDDAIERYNKTGEIFSVFFIDIDHFKQVNDGHGHILGTQLLSDLGDTLKEGSRSNDFLYRYGGDEFVMLLPRVDENLGYQIGERLLNKIKTKDFKLGSEKKHHMSVSIGIAVFPDDAKTRDEILSFADRMMYHAKSSGRGRVCRAKDMVEELPLTESAKK